MSQSKDLRADLAHSHEVLATRAYTERLAAALSAEDQCVQSMPDASPTKWHRGHTTWFFEQFVLVPHLAGYTVFDEAFSFLFNSYYEAVGPRHPRPMRGLLTRPDCAHVTAYRAHVDQALLQLLEQGVGRAVETLLTLGLHHEQQHQELLVTDALHALAQNPLGWRGRGIAVLPGWSAPTVEASLPGPRRFIEFAGGLALIGHAGGGFAYDNEGPRHLHILQPHALADRLVRNAEWLDFMADGGYARSELWMSDGWLERRQEGWEAPMHWRPDDAGGWLQVTPGGCGPLVPDAPVTHISWYEADAFARWTGDRLPTEAELEAAAAELPEFFGHAWQWTNSAYLPYPRFRAPPGAIGEYNGKFMINQMVLRGSSHATPPGHARTSYRNFFPPAKRWQVSGIRLAQDR